MKSKNPVLLDTSFNKTYQRFKLSKRNSLFLLLILVINVQLASAQVEFERFIFEENESHVSYPRSIAQSDIDNDGDLDIIVIGKSLKVFENINNKTFVPYLVDEFTSGEIFNKDVQVADINNDGYDDILIAISDKDLYAYYINNGDNTFSTQKIIDNNVINTDGPHLSEAIDVDGDGKKDIIVASSTVTVNKFLWYKNNGVNNQFTPNLIDDNIINTKGAMMITGADFDNDGDIDFAAASYGAEKIILYENDGLQNFNPIIIDSGTESFSPGSIIYKYDIDNDNDIDILAVFNRELVLYKNLGNNIFEKQIISDLVTSFKCGDFDNDGDIDIVINSNRGLSWLKNDGNENFNEELIAKNYYNTYAINDIEIGDFDGNGYLDIVTSNNRTNRIVVYYNDSSTNFSPELIGFSHFKDPQYITHSDLDQDGDNDLLVASAESDLFFWMKNDGSGNFTYHTIYNKSFAPSSITSVDIDLDGDIDILTTSEQEFLIHYNDGYENFTQKTLDSSQVFARYASSIAYGDIDSDGDIDIIGTSHDYILLFENIGNNNFSTRQIIDKYPNAEGFRSIEIFDLDNDGDLDFIVAASPKNKFMWYENVGNNKFTPHVLLLPIGNSASGGARAITHGDLDNDGDIDLVVAHKNSGTFAWYENDGNQNFTFKVIDDSYQYANGASDIYCADMDNDGDLDLITSASNATTYSWYENNNGNFTRHNITSAYFARSANTVSAVDLDNDGDIDVFGSGTNVFWFKNTLISLGNEDAIITDKDIKIFPNPTSDFIYIGYESANEIKNHEIEMYDMSGKEIEVKLENNKLNIKDLNKGIYLMKIKHKNTVKTFKILKN